MNIVFHTCDYEQYLNTLKLKSLKDKRKINDSMLAYKILNKKFNCDHLLSLIKLQTPVYNCRNTPLIYTEHVNSNVTKYSTINRISEIFNKYCNDLDPFKLAKDKLKKSLMEKCF